MSRRLKYVMFSDAWWDEKRGRHRGRPRPLAARRHYWPRHCNCPFYPCESHEWHTPASLFDIHTARTVAPR